MTVKHLSDEEVLQMFKQQRRSVWRGFLAKGKELTWDVWPKGYVNGRVTAWGYVYLVLKLAMPVCCVVAIVLKEWLLAVLFGASFVIDVLVIVKDYREMKRRGEL